MKNKDIVTCYVVKVENLTFNTNRFYYGVVLKYIDKKKPLCLQSLKDTLEVYNDFIRFKDKNVEFGTMEVSKKGTYFYDTFQKHENMASVLNFAKSFETLDLL